MTRVELELRHLRTVCGIADAGSVTKAAAVLGLSQPALTAQLQRVEREIGAQLFIRGPRGVVPTQIGEFVLSRARATLLSLEELRRGVARYPRAETPVVTLGGAVNSVSVGLAERLGEGMPDIEVRLNMEYSQRLLWEFLVAGRLDAAATIDYPGYEAESSSHIACEVIAVEPVFVALAATDPLAGRDEIDLADLADRTWTMTPSDGAGWPDCFYAACERAGFAPRVRYTTPCGESIRELVATARAVTPCQAVYASGGGVVVRPLVGMPASVRHVMACRRDGPLGAHMADLLRYAREAYWSYSRHRPDYLDWLGRHGLPANSEVFSQVDMHQLSVAGAITRGPAPVG